MLIITCRCYSYARFTDPKLRLREVKSVCRQTCGDQCRSIPPPPSWKENPSLVKLEVCPPSGRLCVLVLKGGPHRGSGSCGMLGKLLNRLSFLISRMGVLILPLAGCGEDEMSQHVCVTQKGSLHVVSPSAWPALFTAAVRARTSLQGGLRQQGESKATCRESEVLWSNPLVDSLILHTQSLVPSLVPRVLTVMFTPLEEMQG